MILAVIISVSIFQLALSIISDWKNIKYGRTVILIVLSGYFLFLPRLFYPKFDPAEAHCGMPILGITLAFWVIGGLSSIVLHTMYSILHKRWKTK
jgi:hypothetical protein